MKCEVCGRTDSECRIRNIKGMCLCPAHVTQMYRHGGFVGKTIYNPNDYNVYKDHAGIVLRNKSQEIVGEALIDLDNVDLCQKYKWHLRKSGNLSYAIASLGNNQKIHLHRLVLDYDGPLDVDHINRDGLDNRKANLRIVSHADNLRNQSYDRKGIKKVPSGKYQAIITKNYEGIYLGSFDTYDEALEARRAAEARE